MSVQKIVNKKFDFFEPLRNIQKKHLRINFLISLKISDLGRLFLVWSLETLIRNHYFGGAPLCNTPNKNFIK